MQWNFRYANWIGDALAMRRQSLELMGWLSKVANFGQRNSHGLVGHGFRMLTVEIHIFFKIQFCVFFFYILFFSFCCEVWERFFEAILKDFGKFDLIVGSDIILSSFDARMLFLCIQVCL